MALSPISPITAEGQPQELSSFLRAGVLYVLWPLPINDTNLKRLHWKPHTGLEFTEVVPSLSVNFRNVTAIYHPSSDQVVVFWDDGLMEMGLENGHIFTARFEALTGAIVSGPTQLFQGSNPKISYRTSAGNELTLFYLTAKSGGIYGRISTDGGLTWGSGEPILTNQVAGSVTFEVLPYDSTHVSIAQVGADTRRLTEIGMLQRSRPLSSIVKHPSIANSFFIGEPSKFDNTTLTDNQRGGLVLSTDNTKLFHLDGVQQGASDTVGAVALVTVTGTAPAVSASAGPTGNGDDLNEYSLVPAAGALNVDLPGASFAVALAVSATHGYVAEYADNSAVLGQLIVVDLTTGSTGTVLSSVAGVRAVGVANFLATPLIFVGTTEGGIERLRVYQQNALSPTLLLNTKLPARANSITVVPHPTNPTGARLLVSMVDRFNIYEYTTSSAPVTLVDSFFFSGGGQFFKSAVSTGGSIVTAAGDAGVVVFDYNGKIKSQLRVSGRIVSEWVQNTAYTVGQVVRTRARHQFARNRFYFTCSSSGTSGNSEPSWASTGTMADGTAQWTPTAVVDGVVSDVALDESTNRIYAVGSVGGALGTSGRLWILDARGLL